MKICFLKIVCVEAIHAVNAAPWQPGDSECSTGVRRVRPLRTIPQRKQTLGESVPQVFG